MSGRTFADQGIEVPPNPSGEVRVTCPRCSPPRKKSRDPCLAVNVDEGIWYCHHCEWSGGIGGGDRYSPRIQEPTREPKPNPYLRNKRRLIETWRATISLDHAKAAPAREYLRYRGLGDLVDRGDLPKVLSFHPHLSYWDTTTRKMISRHPAMVGAVQNSEGITMSLHRTYLAPGGRGKASVTSPKKLMPASVPNGIRGAAIKLYQPQNGRLALTEGIETALAVRLATGLPVWACISASGLANLALPPGIEELTICADNDVKGKEAAHRLAQRVLWCIRQVKVAAPKRTGWDWLDVLRAPEDAA